MAARASVARVASVLMLGACSPRGPEDAQAAPGVAEVDSHVRWQRSTLRLPSATLELAAAPITAQASEIAEACVPLADGGLLATARIRPYHPYESLTLFVDLAPPAEGWKPRAVGVRFACCGAVYWEENVQGRVTIDASNPASLVCDAALVTGDSRAPAFEHVFRIDPREDSAELRALVTEQLPDLRPR